MDDPVFGAGCVGEPQGESLSGGWVGFKFQPRLSFPSYPPGYAVLPTHAMWGYRNGQLGSSNSGLRQAFPSGPTLALV